MDNCAPKTVGLTLTLRPGKGGHKTSAPSGDRMPFEGKVAGAALASARASHLRALRTRRISRAALRASGGFGGFARALLELVQQELLFMRKPEPADDARGEEIVDRRPGQLNLLRELFAQAIPQRQKQSLTSTREQLLSGVTGHPLP